jgi:hypothetical protein
MRKRTFKYRKICEVSGKLAIEQCPRTVRRRVSHKQKLDSCVFHNMRTDVDHMYIHYIMNSRFRRRGRYQINKALDEHDFIGNIFKNDYRALARLLYRLDRSTEIRLAIKSPNPPTSEEIENDYQLVRNHYGNVQAGPYGAIGSRIYQEIKGHYQKGGKINRQFMRGLSDRLKIPFDLAEPTMAKYAEHIRKENVRIEPDSPSKDDK